MSESSLSLLNVFEVELEGKINHLLCFIDPVLAGARGIDGRAVLGEFTPTPDNEFDPLTFKVNPQFIAVFQQFMNEDVGRSAQLANEARNHPGGQLTIVDARRPPNPQVDPPASEIIGGFTIDQAGQIVPGSFQYNQAHLWFHPETGGSSVLGNREFYDWLHSQSP